jgi:hypothetical protein
VAPTASLGVAAGWVRLQLRSLHHADSGSGPLSSFLSPVVSLRIGCFPVGTKAVGCRSSCLVEIEGRYLINMHLVGVETSS